MDMNIEFKPALSLVSLKVQVWLKIEFYRAPINRTGRLKRHRSLTDKAGFVAELRYVHLGNFYALTTFHFLFIFLHLQSSNDVHIYT